MILAVAFVLGRKQTRDLIEPINTLDLEEPLKEVKYEELRPLLKRVDQQRSADCQADRRTERSRGRTKRIFGKCFP